MLQDKALQIPASEALVKKTRDAILFSFLLGMDHAESKIQLAEILPEPLAFEEAINFMKGHITLSAIIFYDLESKLRFRAFTVARLTQLDAIDNIRERLADVLKEGKTLSQFWDEGGKDELLQKSGFHKSNPWYWETVFRTNIQTSYNAGRAMQFKENPPPYYEFIGITDSRQTQICQARSGIIKPSDDPFWSSNWPPLHFACRSTIRGVHKEEFEISGLKVTEDLKDTRKYKAQKGFGGNPIDTGSFYKLTPEMKKRAREFGVIDEIERLAKKLKLKDFSLN
ncbi:MAG: minor capsid protein [Nitrospinae bacterium]|nr:minor capsid protein [Nitrospinota bacterium]